VLYHRPVPNVADLHEIVLSASHDGGQTWREYNLIGRESTDATYAGAMDASGNLYVAYGRYAEGRLGGGLKLRKLTFDSQRHVWLGSEESQIIWDWPGQGISDPILKFGPEGSRLWMLYSISRDDAADRPFASLEIQYADPDETGNYPPEAWSEPAQITLPNSEPLENYALIVHGDELGVMYSSGFGGVYWRILENPSEEANRWRAEAVVLEAQTKDQPVKFSVSSDGSDTIDVAVRLDSVLVAHMRYSGGKWSSPRQLDQSRVDWPMFARAEDTLWAFWQKQPENGAPRIQVKPSTTEAGWAQRATMLYSEDDGAVPLPPAVAEPTPSPTPRATGEQAPSQVPPVSYGSRIETVGAHDSQQVSVVWSDTPGGWTESGGLWFASISLASIQETALPVPNVTAEELNPSKPAPETILENITETTKVQHIPDGAYRQYSHVSLDIGQVHEYQLIDGQVRYIEVLETRTEFRTDNGVAVWVPVTLRVSGPGLEPQTGTIPAAYFQVPLILNDVRIWVEVTKQYNDARLRDGGGTNNDARLMLSDARYSLTNVEKYAWPFPGVLWGEGWASTYYQGLQGSYPDILHHGAWDLGMPLGYSLQAWAGGTLDVAWRQFDWATYIADADDGYDFRWHTGLHVDNGLNLEQFGERIERGDFVGPVLGITGYSHIHWGSGAFFDHAPVFAEWYVAHATPIERSYVKDWLVLGPFTNLDDETRLNEPYIPNEETVRPKDGDSAGIGDMVWRRFDDVVPGVVDVAETVTPYPRSGWTKVTGNQPFSVSYMLTYAYSAGERDVTLNFGSSDAIKAWVNDEVVLVEDTVVDSESQAYPTIYPDAYKATVRLRSGWNRILVKLAQGTTTFPKETNHQKTWQMSFRISDADGNPAEDVIVNPERNVFADPLARYVIGTPRTGTSEAPDEASEPAAETLVRTVEVDVDSLDVVNQFSAENRGLNTYLQNWNADVQIGEGFVFGFLLAETARALKPGVVRLSAGGDTVTTGWSRRFDPQTFLPDQWSDDESEGSYTYAQAISPAVVDRFAGWTAEIGASAMIGVNVCDDNPEMWADLVRYANVEHDYAIRYWDLGAGLRQNTTQSVARSCLGVGEAAGPAELARRIGTYTNALKSVDPEIVVVAPVMTQPTAIGSWMSQVLDTLGENGVELDAASWQWYQLTAQSEIRSSSAFEAGSSDALLNYDRIVGDSCLSLSGQTLCGGDQIPSDNLSLMTLRRKIADAIMPVINENITESAPGALTAMTQYGPHATLEDTPLYSNHLAALWLADILPRWAYNGLDIAAFDSLEGFVLDEDTKGLLGITVVPESLNAPIIDTDEVEEAPSLVNAYVRPVYLTMLLYAQHFGDSLVRTESNDPSNEVVVWAAKDSNNDDELTLMLVNLSGEQVTVNIDTAGFAPAVGYGFEMTSRAPFATADDDYATLINGQDIPDIATDGILAWLESVSRIAAKRIETSSGLSYDLKPYSVVAIGLNTDAQAAWPTLIRDTLP
jgi:hypothetical protein